MNCTMAKEDIEAAVVLPDETLDDDEYPVHHVVIPSRRRRNLCSEETMLWVMLWLLGSILYFSSFLLMTSCSCRCRPYHASTHIEDQYSTNAGQSTMMNAIAYEQFHLRDAYHHQNYLHDANLASHKNVHHHHQDDLFVHSGPLEGPDGQPFLLGPIGETPIADTPPQDYPARAISPDLSPLLVIELRQWRSWWIWILSDPFSSNDSSSSDNVSNSFSSDYSVDSPSVSKAGAVDVIGDDWFLF